MHYAILDLGYLYLVVLLKPNLEINEKQMSQDRQWPVHYGGHHNAHQT